MAINSSAFGRVELSGSDADRFEQQIAERKPNPLARDALKRGREAVRLMKDMGLYPQNPQIKN